MNPESFSLTVEQQFQMRLIEESTTNLSKEQLVDLLLQTSKILMIKENLLKDLLKSQISGFVGLPEMG